MTPRKLARSVTLAILIALAIVNIYHAATGWTMSDAAAYWGAAMRLRAGADLYPTLPSVDASEVYRYAPWFAWLALPWTFLPIQAAGALWSGVLLAASGLAVWPLVKARAWLLVMLFAPILVGISAVGNVQPLMIATLTLGIHTRTGPLWVAGAASLKIFPVLLAAVYAGRREWGRLATTVLVTTVLWAPAFLYDLRNYATDAGQAAILYGFPPLYVAVAGLGLATTVAAAHTRCAWLAAATTVCVALPRFFVYDLTYLMIGVSPSRDANDQFDPATR